MFLSTDFVAFLEVSLGQLLSKRIKVLSYQPVGGGDINHCFRLETSGGYFFLKVNGASDLPNLFLLESEGLKMLRTQGGMPTPEVIGNGQFQDLAYLLLTWLETEEATRNAQAALGERLAFQHRQTQEKFGLDYDNYLGNLPQSNALHHNWASFFVEERLKKQLIFAKQKQLFSKDTSDAFGRLFERLPELCPEEAPALLHGDLWSGNVMFLKGGGFSLIDPAVYYGHREMDIALTRLFGGFDYAFYEAYQEVYPLSPGWEERVDLWNLYVLLFHANAFGGSYIERVKGIVSRYAG